jgi:hypothetical protein
MVPTNVGLKMMNITIPNNGMCNSHGTMFEDNKHYIRFYPGTQRFIVFNLLNGQQR